jgi:hypothetical protein
MMLIILLAVLVHPIHISVAEVRFSEDSKTFQLSQRIFVDDLEAAINKENSTSLDILKLEDSVRNKILRRYLLAKIEIRFDNKKTVLNYIGSEMEEGVCWVYFESAKTKSFKQITLKNVALFELFDDQSTIIQIEKDKTVKSFRLFGEKVEEIIVFE